MLLLGNCARGCLDCLGSWRNLEEASLRLPSHRMRIAAAGWTMQHLCSGPPVHPPPPINRSSLRAERIAVGSTHADCAQAAYKTPNVKECYGADGCGGTRSAAACMQCCCTPPPATWRAVHGSLTLCGLPRVYTLHLRTAPRQPQGRLSHPPSPPCRYKYYRRGQTETSIPPPHWLNRARLGQSAGQQVRLKGGCSRRGPGKASAHPRNLPHPTSA